MPQWQRLIHSTTFSLMVSLAAACLVLTLGIWKPDRVNPTALFSFTTAAFGFVWGVSMLIKHNTGPTDQPYRYNDEKLSEADLVYVTVAVAVFRIMASIATWIYLARVREVTAAHTIFGVIAAFVTLVVLDRTATGKIPKDVQTITVSLCVIVVILVLFF